MPCLVDRHTWLPMHLVTRWAVRYRRYRVRAATMYGIMRVTYDIDIIVDMGEEHIQSLSEAYPLPRYCADPGHRNRLQMRRAAEIGSSFNIIDVERGEKADLIPLSMNRRNELAIEMRMRRTIDMVVWIPFPSGWHERKKRARRPEEEVAEMWEHLRDTARAEVERYAKTD